MNAKNLDRFFNYLCAVVKYYQTHRSLKKFSNLAREYKCKAITQELFFQFDLDKETGIPSRELSDKIRLLMAEMEMKRRSEQLTLYMGEHENGKKDASEDSKKEFEQYEKRLQKMLEYRQKVLKSTWEIYENTYRNGDKSEAQVYGPVNDFEDLLCLGDWKNEVEFRFARDFFSKLDVDTVLENMLNMSEPVMHSFLTYIFGGEDGVQIKFDFDARGEDSYSNDALENILAEYGVFNDCLFHKLESWKGCGHMCIVYKEAPDVLMIIGDEQHGLYTVDDDVFSSYCGNTIINPNHDAFFGGWGTRSIIAECIHTILTCKNEAIEAQKNVCSDLKGKLMEDLRHADDIRAMYREEWEKKAKHQ